MFVETPATSSTNCAPFLRLQKFKDDENEWLFDVTLNSATQCIPNILTKTLWGLCIVTPDATPNARVQDITVQEWRNFCVECPPIMRNFLNALNRTKLNEARRTIGTNVTFQNQQFTINNVFYDFPHLMTTLIPVHPAGEEVAAAVVTHFRNEWMWLLH